MPVRDVLRTARRDPSRALVELWSELRSKPELRAFAVGAWQEQDEYQEARYACRAYLESRDWDVPRALTDEMALAVLEELDLELAGRRRGQAPFLREVRVPSGHYYVAPRPPGWWSAFRRQPAQLQSWLHHHWVVPSKIGGYDVRFVQRRVRSDRRLWKAVQKGAVRVLVAGFQDGVAPDWQWRGDGPEEVFHADALDDEELRWKYLARILDDAHDARAHVVVLPELTIPNRLRERVRKWLREKRSVHLQLVVPGSFHVRRRREGGTVRFNAATLLDGHGTALLHHDKLTQLGWKGEEDRPHCCEGNAIGTRIDVLSTTLGAVAVPICLDFCQAGHPFPALWEEIGVAWALVPSMGDDTTVHAHERRARDTWTSHGQVTAVANQPVRAGEDEHSFGLVCPASGRREVSAASGALRTREGYLTHLVTVSWPPTR